MLHLLEGPVKDTLRRIEEEKAQHLARIEHTTSLLLGVPTTAVLQPLPQGLMT